MPRTMLARRTLLLAVFLALFALPLFAVAETPEEEGRYYVREGERVTSTRAVTVDGTTYHVILVSGAPTVVLRENADASFTAVFDAGVLSSVSTAYLRASFDLTPFDDAFVAGVNAHYAAADEPLADCAAGLDVVRRAPSSQTLRTLRQGRSTYYPAVWAQYCRVYAHDSFCVSDREQCLGDVSALPLSTQSFCANADFRLSQVPVAAFLDRVAALDAAVASLGPSLSARDATGVSEALSAIASSASGLKADYAVVSEMYASMVGTFPYVFNEGTLFHSCAQNPALSTALDGLVTLAKQNQPFSADELAARFQAEGTARAAFSTNLRAYLAERTAYDALASRTQALAANYSLSGLPLPFFGSLLSNVQSRVDAIRTATGEAEIASATASFRTSLADLNAKVDAFAAAYPPYQSGKEQQSRAFTGLGAARERVGPNDGRLLEIQGRFDAAQASWAQQEGVLRAGATANATALAALVTDFSMIAAEAEALQPPYSSIDLALVAGGVLVLVLLGGALWFFRRRNGGGKPLALVHERPVE